MIKYLADKLDIPENDMRRGLFWGLLGPTILFGFTIFMATLAIHAKMAAIAILFLMVFGLTAFSIFLCVTGMDDGGLP
jgi:hypothetical protein